MTISASIGNPYLKPNDITSIWKVLVSLASKFLNISSLSWRGDNLEVSMMIWAFDLIGANSSLSKWIPSKILPSIASGWDLLVSLYLATSSSSEASKNNILEELNSFSSNSLTISTISS